jgi:hypothetical protein
MAVANSVGGRVEVLAIRECEAQYSATGQAITEQIGAIAGIGGSAMKNLIVRLWRGEAGLGRSFWEFAVLYGSLMHLIATGAAFAVIVAGGPAWIAVLIFFLPSPYTILVVVAVWRAAGRYRGPESWSTAARIAVIVWALLATVL